MKQKIFSDGQEGLNAFADQMKEGGTKYEKGKVYTLPAGTEFTINRRNVVVEEPIMVRIDAIDYEVYQVSFVDAQDALKDVHGWSSGWLKKGDDEKSRLQLDDDVPRTERDSPAKTWGDYFEKQDKTSYSVLSEDKDLIRIEVMSGLWPRAIAAGVAVRENRAILFEIDGEEFTITPEEARDILQQNIRDTIEN